jgi:hypothetical protein
VVRHRLTCFLGHAVAAVLGAVQVQGRLGDVRAQAAACSGCPFFRAEPVGVELSPVVAQGRFEVGRIADAFLDFGEVLGAS